MFPADTSIWCRSALAVADPEVVGARHLQRYRRVLHALIGDHSADIVGAPLSRTPWTLVGGREVQSVVAAVGPDEALQLVVTVGVAREEAVS